jgi:hypothetical protein
MSETSRQRWRKNKMGIIILYVQKMKLLFGGGGTI